MKTAYLLAAFAPLFGAVVAGFFGRRIGRAGAHWVTILGVAVSMFASFWVLRDVLAGNTFNGTLYAWSVIGDLKLEVGFLIDKLIARGEAGRIGAGGLPMLERTVHGDILELRLAHPPANALGAALSNAGAGRLGVL